MKLLSALMLLVLLVLVCAFAITVVGCLGLMMFDNEIKSIMRTLTRNLEIQGA